MSEPHEGARSIPSPELDSSTEYEETLRSFGDAEVVAAVDLRCEQLEVLQRWQDRHRHALGDAWVTDIGREVDYWILLLDAADRLPDNLVRRLRAMEAAAGLWASLLTR